MESLGKEGKEGKEMDRERKGEEGKGRERK